MLTLKSHRGWRRAVKKIPGVNLLVGMSIVVENWWFDFYHRVDTSPQLREQGDRGWLKDRVNLPYLPIRPKCARRVLQDLPLESRREYTFVDFGSGKGRMLLIAAKQGFGCLSGIELRKSHHEQACRNFRECRNIDRCNIQSFNLDAADYEFPNDKLVVFFNNPFGSEVMEKVLHRLSASLDRCFRDVWVVLQEPTCPYLADQSPQLKIEAVRNGYRLYRSTREPRPNGIGSPSESCEIV